MEPRTIDTVRSNASFSIVANGESLFRVRDKHAPVGLFEVRKRPVASDDGCSR